MRMNRWVLSGVALVMLTQSRGHAINAAVTDADIHRATVIATGTKEVRARFHAPYILPVSDPIVDRIDVITEFRRFVLASEEQAALGNWMVARGGHDAKRRTLKDILEPWRGQVAIRLSVRFHPQHRYSSLPPIDVLVGEPSFLALDVVRTPQMAPLMSLKNDEKTSVMTGAVIETTFNAQSLEDRALPVRVVFDGKEIVRVTADFARLE